MRRDPRTVVDAGSPVVGDALRDLVHLVVANGGRLHPGLRLVERGGQLHVECEPAGPGPAASDPTAPVTLIHLPRELLVPVAGVTWSDRRDLIGIADPAPDHTPLQRDVLDLLLAIFNGADKLPHYLTHHPRGALAAGTPLVAAIRGVQPDFTPTPSARAFLATREFSAFLPGHAEEPEPRPAQRVLMPLVDLLNHHSHAARFELDDARLCVRLSQPDGTDQCFVDYGRLRDALDLALQYGFVDPGSRIAYSAPLTIEIDGIGEVIVGRGRPLTGRERTYPAVTLADAGITFSHLLLDADHPDRLRAAIGLPVRARAIRAGATEPEADRLAGEVHDALVAANIDILDAIVDEAALVAGPAAQTVADAARRHRELASAL